MSPTSGSGRITCWMLYTIIFVILCKTQVASSEGKTESKEAHHEVDKKRQDLIPYPRIGRSTDAVKDFLLEYQAETEAADQDSNKEKNQEQKQLPSKHQEKVPDHATIPVSEYMLPYLRPGRSDTPPQESNNNESTDDDDEEEEGETTMIPYPRFGRSPYQEMSQSVIPYPRFGRAAESHLLVPYPRFGRSENIYSGSVTPYPRFGKRQGSVMMIPYPRLGKRGYGEELILPYPRLGRSESSDKNQVEDAWKILNGEWDYITPYPRMGKRYSTVSGLVNDDETPPAAIGKKSSMDGLLLPTFRMGRSSDTLLPQTRLGRNYKDQTIVPLYRSFPSDYGLDEEVASQHFLVSREANDESAKDYMQNLELFQQGYDTITPYPRMGKRTTDSDLMLPQIRIGRSTGEKEKTTSETLEDKRRPSVSDAQVLNNRDSNNRRKRSPETYSILPYPRFGRSGDFSKAHADEVNAKLRAQMAKLLHNPTEQNYILPYMRPGRSSNKHYPLNDRISLIPYLRARQ